MGSSTFSSHPVYVRTPPYSDCSPGRGGGRGRGVGGRGGGAGGLHTRPARRALGRAEDQPSSAFSARGGVTGLECVSLRLADSLRVVRQRVFLSLFSTLARLRACR